MSYILKKDNAFYGSKGDKISNQLYNRLPSQHQLLFEKYDCNNSEYNDSISRMRKLSFKVNNEIQEPNGMNDIEDAFALYNAYFEDHNDEFLGEVEANDPF